MTPLSKSQKKAMAEHRRKKPKLTSEDRRLQRQLDAKVLKDRLVLKSGVTRMYPWPRHYYKSPPPKWCECPGTGRYDRLSPNVTTTWEHHLPLLVQLVQYVRPALREYRAMRPTARVMMHQFSGWEAIRPHKAGLLCITAPKGYRPSSALLVSVNGVRPLAARVSLHVFTATCPGPGLYRLAEPEQLGVGPWFDRGTFSYGDSATHMNPEWSMDSQWRMVRATVFRPQSDARSVVFPEVLADSFLAYMREWLFNIRIPGPQ
jgi:hypothetical protein